MKIVSPAFALCAALLSPALTSRAESAAPAFYGDPPDQHHPWAVHDGNRPQPKVVTPGTFSSQEQPGKPPSDAIVLFDGTDLSKWQSVKDGGPAKWAVKGAPAPKLSAEARMTPRLGSPKDTPGMRGSVERKRDQTLDVAPAAPVMEVVPKTGDIRTREEFGDCQLHVEWAEPPDVQGSSQGRGNSGIFLMGLVEIQVLDVYHNLTYADGGAGSVYGVHPALANALRPPGEFQVYDIIFRRPIYKDGQVVDPGYVTVLVNGVVAQDHALLEGPTGHMKRTQPCPFPEKGPLQLQDHGNPVKFRNIWYRPLPPRVSEGGTDGYLSPEATMAKRKQIAAAVRQDAAGMQEAVPQLLRYMESLVYEKDPATVQQVEQSATAYVASVRQVPAGKLSAKKDEVKRVGQAFNYLVRFQILPENFAPHVELQQIIKQRGWDKK